MEINGSREYREEIGGYYINVDTFVYLLEKQPSEDSNIRVGISNK